MDKTGSSFDLFRWLILGVISVFLLLAAFSPQTIYLKTPTMLDADLSLPPLVPRDKMYGVAIPQPDQIWVVGNFGKILRSEDGGSSWNRQQSGVDQYLMEIEAWDSERALAIGDNGTVLVTDDGGENWSRVPNAYQDKINERGINKLLNLDIAPGGHAWAVGQWGMVMESRDYGRSWKRISEPRDINLYDVKQVRPGLLAVVGEFGEMTRGTRSDTGVWSWEKVPTPVEQTIKAVAFRSDTQGVAVGLKGLVIRTTDGGKTWEQVKDPNSTHLYDVIWTGQNWLATGDGGQLVSSEPPAHNWVIQSLARFEYGWHTELKQVPDGNGGTSTIFVGANLGSWKEGTWTRFGS